LITVEWGLAGAAVLRLREVIDRHDVLVATVRSDRATKLIRARLRRKQDRRGTFPIFGRGTGRDRFEFLNAFQAVDDAGAAAVILFVVDAIDQHVVVLAAAP